jgi:hypothetical protein
LDVGLKAAKARRDAANPQATKLLNTTKPRHGTKPDVNTTKMALGVNTTKPEPSVNTTKPRLRTKPVVNTTGGKPRSADRHLEPNRDRHSPGYMREYMRRRRAAKM